MLASAAKALVPPAACHEEPAVSSERSKRATSVHPALARW